MGSRWMKRSEEEKKRILDTEIKKHFKEDLYISHSEERYKEILEQYEIPLFCMEHGYVVSKEYKMIYQTVPISEKRMPFIIGHCPICNRQLSKAHTILQPDAIVIALIIEKLRKDGRLTGSVKNGEDNG